MAIKRYFFELLKDRYERNKQYVERISVATLTKEDYESLGRLMADVYESGFLRAVDQYKDQISKLGLNVNVVADKSPAPSGPKIFRED